MTPFKRSLFVLFSAVFSLRIPSILFAATSIFLLHAQFCFSQIGGIPDAANAGVPINGVFSGGSIDSVQLNNGNLHLDIPLLDIPGVGIPIHIHYLYDSKVWNYVSDPVSSTYYVLQDSPSSRISFPGAVRYSSATHTENQPCGPVTDTVTYLDSLAFVDEEGTAHPFPVGRASMSGGECEVAAPIRFHASDSSGIVGDRVANSSSLADVITRSGQKYTFSPTNTGEVDVEDSNGNKLIYTYSVNSQNYSRTAVVTDTLGRTFQMVERYQDEYQPSTISYIDQNGQTQVITITYTTLTPNIASLCALEQGFACQGTFATPTVPSTITLQDGSTYQFNYQSNGLGNLSSLTLPTGGTISWSYGQTDVSGDKVIGRTVSANGQTSQWGYQYNMTASPAENATNTVIVTDPMLNDTRYTCTIHGTLPLGLPTTAQLAPCYMTKQEVFDGSVSGGNSILVKNTGYTITGTVLPTSTTLSWTATGQVAETDTTWDSIPNSGYYSGGDIPSNDVSAGNIISQNVYDYGSGSHGPLLQNKQYTYLNQQNSAYASANIMDRLAQESIYDFHPTLVSQVTTSYDQFNQASVNGQGGLIQTTGTTNHDYTNFSSSATLRGLPTSVTSYVGASASPVVTYVNYNDLGMKTVDTDARGNSTSYTYDSQNAFIQSIHLPSTNGVEHVVTEGHDVNTGLLAWEKDQNNNQTSYTFDPRMRPLTIQRPDGGSTSYSYPDSNHIDMSISLSSSAAISSNTVLDGLGRTMTTVAPNGATVATNYDLMGRVYSVTNPYFTTSDATYSVKTYTYDSLGRLALQTQPDNSTQSWSYSGNVTTFTDEVKNSWQRTTDALGRLTVVVEPGNLQTGYTYDALGNLWNVTQTGTSGETPRIRSLTYDSLSRLITSTNPETGTICYGYWSASSCVNGYDANGNLANKTDARGITANYTYDALNRLTNKTASDGSINYSYAYDGTDRPGVQNPIGRLTHSSNNVNAASNYDYDAMGRVVDNYVCAPLYCTYTLGTAATYDLAGNMATSRDAAGITTGMTYDGAGRLNGVTTTPWGSSTVSTLLSNTIYGPIGLIESSLGNGLREEFTYDTRSRVNSYAVGKADSAGTGGTPPFGVIESAVNNGSGGSSVPQGGLIRANGWAADTEDGAPVAEIEVLLDGKVLGLATPGGARPDVASAYNRSDFTNSGWSFTGSIGSVAPGTHVISAVAYDWSGNSSTLTNFPNLAKTITVTSDNPPFGYIEPVTGVATGTSTVIGGGLITMLGWAADIEDGAPVASVHVLLDGLPIGNATLGLSRPDVAAAYNRSDFTNSGWSFTGSVRAASLGTHTITAVAYDSSGNESVLTGSYSITVIANSQTIDSAMDGVANASNSSSNMISLGGSITVSGWSAEPDQNPGAPITRVEVEIDGQFLGLATLGGQRPDVSSAWNRPDFLSSGWTFTGPVTNVDPGEHSIGARAYTQDGGSYLVPIVQQNQEIIVAGTTPPISVGATQTKYSYALNYAPNGNVVNAADTVNGNWAYGYDSLNRLTSALSPSTGVSWSYDSFGNRGQQMPILGSAPSPVATYSTATNRLDGVCYDAAGNVLDDGPCPLYGAHKYAYDAEEKMISSNYGNTTYIYDAEGRRVAKANSGTVSNVYFYDVAGHVASEANGANVIVRSEIYAGSRHLATYQGTNIFYNHASWLGTDAARSDATGTLCETLSSLPFGDAQQTSGTCFPSPTFFTGKERDTESGLDYFGARHYSSTMGRFMSPDPGWFFAADPSNPQSWNGYAYAMNNPLSNVDPDGYDCIYLNDAGNGVESNDQHSNSGECGQNHGYWVDGTATHVQLYSNNNDVGLSGHTTDSQGNQTPTDSFYTSATGHLSDAIQQMGYTGLTGTVELHQLYNNRPNMHMMGPQNPVDVWAGCISGGVPKLALDLSPIGIVPDALDAAMGGSVNPLFNSGDKANDAGNAVEVAGKTAEALQKTLPFLGPVAKHAGPIGMTLSVYKYGRDAYNCAK